MSENDPKYILAAIISASPERSYFNKLSKSLSVNATFIFLYLLCTCESVADPSS